MTSLRIITIIALSLLFEILSNAQNFPSWSWVKQSKGFASTGYALTVNEAKDVYLSCIYQDSVVSVEQYKFPNQGYADALIVKYDSCGNITWTKSFGAEGEEFISSMVTDSYNNLYVAGVYTSLSLRIDNFIVKNIDINYGYEVFIMKFNSNGKLMWVNTINGKNTEGYPHIAINSNDELLVTGSTTSDSIFFGIDTLYNTSDGSSRGDIYLINYSNEGKVIWSKMFGGADYEDYPFIAIDKLDNIYLTGCFTSKEFIIDSIKLTNKSVKNQAFLYYDVFLIKLDDNGKAIWGNSYGGDKHEYVNSITVDKLNNVYINGLFTSPKIKFDDSIYTISRNNVFDNFALKLNTNGNLIWTKVFVANNYSIINGAIQVDDYLNVYITGQTNFPGITVDSFQGTNNFAGHTDLFLIKLDSNANLIWGTSIGSNSVENVFDMKVLANDELVITGHFASDTLLIDNSTLLYESKGGFNYFIAKLGGPIKTSTSVNDKQSGLLIYPNPADKRIHIILPPEKMDQSESTKILLYDCQGNYIDVNAVINPEKIHVDLSDIQNGLYLISIMNSKGRFTEKIIVNKE